MQISTTSIAGRILPENVLVPLRPLLEKVDETLFSNTDDAVSRRVAMIAFSIRVVSAVIAYVSQVVLARWMGTTEYGIFIAVWVAAVILGGLACLGFQTASIRFISEYRETGDEDSLRGIIIVSMSFSFVVASIIAGMGMFALHFAGDIVANYYVMPIFLAAVCLPLLALSEVQDGIARAYNWPMVALGPTFLVRPTLILIVMALALIYGFEASAVTAMSCTIIAAFLATAQQFISLFIKLRREVPRGPAKYAPRQWVLVAMPIFLVEGFYNLLTNTDILFVSYYLPPSEVGVYFAAVKTLALVHFVYFAVKAATAHRFTSYKAAGNKERYEAYIQKTVRWVFWPSIVLSVLMAFLGDYFLRLFGPEFAGHQHIIWILALGIVFRATVGPAESVLTMSGQQNACARIYGFAFVVNLALNAALIPYFGLVGAATATTLAMLFESILLFTVTRKRLGLHVFIIPNRIPADDEAKG